MVGFKIEFESYAEEDLGRREHYWIFGKQGGVFLKVFLRDDAEFDPREWGLGSPLPNQLAACRAKVNKAIQTIEEIKLPETIKVDPVLVPPVKDQGKGGKAKKEPEIVVEILEDGTMMMDGEIFDLKSLEVMLTDRARKLGPTAVLKIRAAQNTEFKFVQRVIKAGSKAGLKQVTYAAFGNGAKKEKE